MENNIVIADILGTLGNFMFIAAAGYDYAERNGRKFYYHTKDKYYDDERVKFITDKFNRIETIPEDNEYCSQLLKRRYESLPEPVDGKPMVIKGFFQDEHYFDRDRIYGLYKCPEEEKKRIFEKYGDLSDYVSISVRHATDYLHLAPTAEWYKGIAEKYFKGRKFFIASDNHEWTVENLKDIPNAIFSDASSFSEDLYGASLCQDHIVYNGTFGWWVAWLGEERLRREGKISDIVIKGVWDSEDTIPDRWIIDGLD